VAATANKRNRGNVGSPYFVWSNFLLPLCYWRLRIARASRTASLSGPVWALPIRAASETIALLTARVLLARAAQLHDSPSKLLNW
jgi:hypothetical protein